MGHDKNRGKDLDTTREALASWRRLHGGRGRPIPAALWSDAAEVARANGVAETARALRLDPRRLAKLAEGRAESAPRGVVEAAARGARRPGAGEPREPRAVVVELVGVWCRSRARRGVVGGAGSAVELVALAG